MLLRYYFQQQLCIITYQNRGIAMNFFVEALKLVHLSTVRIYLLSKISLKTKKLKTQHGMAKLSLGQRILWNHFT